MNALTRLLFLLALVCVGFGVQAKGPELAMEEFMVQATDDASIQLYVRNKHPRGVKEFPGEKILLFVHGATYPAETSFDMGAALLSHGFSAITQPI